MQTHANQMHEIFSYQITTCLFRRQNIEVVCDLEK